MSHEADAQIPITMNEFVPMLKDLYHRTCQELENTKYTLNETRETMLARISDLEQENARLREDSGDLRDGSGHGVQTPKSTTKFSSCPECKDPAGQKNRLEEQNSALKPCYSAHNDILDMLPAVEGLPCKHSELKPTKRKALESIAKDLPILFAKAEDCVFGQTRPEHLIYFQNSFSVARRAGDGKWDLSETAKLKFAGDVVHIWVRLLGRSVYYGKYEAFEVDVDFKDLEAGTKVLDRLIDLTVPDPDAISPLVRAMMQRMYEACHIVPLATGFKCVGFDDEVYRRSQENPENPGPEWGVDEPSSSSSTALPIPLAEKKKGETSGSSKTPKRPAESMSRGSTNNAPLKKKPKRK